MAAVLTLSGRAPAPAAASPCRVLNLEAVKSAPVTTDPYPFFVVDQCIRPERLDAVLAQAPHIRDGGSFPMDNFRTGPDFEALLAELGGPALREVLEQKFGLSLAGRPCVTTARGYSRAKDGRIHRDSKSKLVTILIYLNGKEWPDATGRLRILRSKTDMNASVAEIAPTGGSLVAFKVTENGWHGYPAFEGERRSIQFNYVADEGAVHKHQTRHGFTAWLKKLKRRLFGGYEE